MAVGVFSTSSTKCLPYAALKVSLETIWEDFLGKVVLRGGEQESSSSIIWVGVISKFLAFLKGDFNFVKLSSSSLSSLTSSAFLGRSLLSVKEIDFGVSIARMAEIFSLLMLEVGVDTV